MKDKKILLCVTGGIAAYKAIALTSKLIQKGAIVKVIMSDSAVKFVTPLAFQALSRNDVYTDTFEEKDPKVISHIELADWADIVLIAPATANVIGKLANGIADDMITTTLLATKAPVWVAPAMNVNMYDHPAVRTNMTTLTTFGYHFIEPQAGFLACGWIGKGRLEEPETIVQLLEDFFSENKGQQLILKDKKLLVTAGPTVEIIDPVRYLTNRSSGKMGYAIAEAAQHLGAEVVLISGPTALQPPPNVQTIFVESAEQMLQEVLKHYDQSDIVIKAAAVADYRPKFVSESKIKKNDGSIVIEMERTTDILKTLGEKKKQQLLVGFAAETNNVEQYAKGKLEKKNLDYIVANNVTEEGAGFNTDTNIISIYSRNEKPTFFPKLTKLELAYKILQHIASKGSDM